VLSANSAALIGGLVQTMPAVFLSEVQTPQQKQLAAAIGTIIAEQMLLGFGTGVVVGIVSPASAVGAADCRLVVT
jgi:hypothetical protein